MVCVVETMSACWTNQTILPANVVNSAGDPLNAEGESLFLGRLFEALQARMLDDFNKFTFVVHRWRYHERKGAVIDLRPGDDMSVLILLADEREVFPTEDFASYRVIFRSYGYPEDATKRVYPFPSGYLGAAGATDSVPFDERPTTLFFSGYLNRNRIDLYKQFRPVGWLPQQNLCSRYAKELARRAVERFCKERSFDGIWPGSKIAFTEWFGRGMEPSVYAKTLAGSKIALCPPGFVSAETIRHWEAMRLGCVIVSAPLPPNRFYRGSPIIELEDWSSLRRVVDDLLSDPAELKLRHEAMCQWWKNMTSEPAVAEYMARVIRDTFHHSA